MEVGVRKLPTAAGHFFLRRRERITEYKEGVRRKRNRNKREERNLEIDRKRQ